MSAPVVTSITPSNNATDIVLGMPITVVFDQAIDPATVSGATFIVFGPGETGVINPDQLVQNDPKIVTGREYIPGTFTFPAANSFVFNPKVPLRPNTQYTILLAGAGTIVVKDSIKNPAGQALASSVQTVFTTGVLNQSAVPPSAPLPWLDPSTQPWERPTIDPNTINVTPVEAAGNDLSQQIVLTFPGPIDPASFNPADVLCKVEPISNDPLVQVPAGLNYNVQVVGNQLIISVGSWPAPPPAPLPLPASPIDGAFEEGPSLLFEGRNLVDIV